ncbi:MAG: hypothetical protein CFE31_06510 [Rhizobiales bacterium PAR1]|nr:MAG: hypothetical protein CFE31_06510 [Rhizobiales bacterium PAR1]
MSESSAPFWKTKRLDDMSEAEWESLCDGCGRCCLIKMEDEDTGRYYFTDVACKLFDAGTCRCRDYPNRDKEVPDCVRLTPENAGSLGWMPPSCAYRLLSEGKNLPEWHPLVSGDPKTVETAGVSIRNRVFALENEVSIPELVERIRKWPGQWPRRPSSSVTKMGK